MFFLSPKMFWKPRVSYNLSKKVRCKRNAKLLSNQRHPFPTKIFKKRCNPESPSWRSYQGVLGNPWLYEVPLQCSYQAGHSFEIEACKKDEFSKLRGNIIELIWKMWEAWTLGSLWMISCENCNCTRFILLFFFVLVQDDTVCMNLYKRACALNSLWRGKLFGKQPTKTGIRP